MRGAALAAALAVCAAAPSELLVFDSTYISGLSLNDGYEHQHLLAALSGLANRNMPSVYVVSQAADAYWLSQLTAPGGWLAGTQLDNVTSIVQLTQMVSTAYRGVVLYDPSVWPTSLLASTAAGVEDVLPIAYRPAEPTSLYNQLVAGGPKLPVLRSLVGLFNATGTGSVKLNAYTWAVNEWLSPGASGGGGGGGGANPALLAYYLDYYFTTRPDVPDPFSKSTVPNHDYFIANRAFFFDLSVWADVAPVDDPTQPLGSDLAAFRLILEAAYNGTGGDSMIHIGGFTPWAYKYVDQTHQGVATEWETVQLTSAYNAFVDADACCIANMANAALFASYPLADRYVQRSPPSQQALIDAGYMTATGSVVGSRLYYMNYFGDFDSAAWLYSQMPPFWSDPARGSIPLGWGVDPELALRFPPLFDVMLPGATHNDVIISGDSGAGYINPTLLYGQARQAISGLPDGNATWQAYQSSWYQLFGMTFTGFAISGNAPQMDPAAEELYYPFSANGVVDQGWPGMVAHLSGNLPVAVQWDLGATPVSTILSFFNTSDPAPQFHMFRTVLTAPSYIAEIQHNVTAQSGGNVIAVDPLTLGYLMRAATGGSNDDRVAYVNDTLPDSAVAGTSLAFTVTVRNDGWNTLDSSDVAVLARVTGVEVYRPDPRATGRLNAAHRAATTRAAGGVPANAARRRAWAIRSGLLPRPAATTTTPKAVAATGWGAGDAVVVPLPANLPPGNSSVVALTVQLPYGVTGNDATPADSVAVAIVQYQLARTGSNGSVWTFDANGNPPWSAAVLLA